VTPKIHDAFLENNMVMHIDYRRMRQMLASHTRISTASAAVGYMAQMRRH